MRTTLTLDDDVAAKLAATSRKTGQPFKQVVNAVLRQGLLANAETKRADPFVVEAQRMGALKPGVTLDKISAVLDVVDGPQAR